MPWYHGWNVLAVAMLFQAVTFGIGIYSFTFWVAPWSADFAVGRGEVMTVFITLLVAMGALAPMATGEPSAGEREGPAPRKEIAATSRPRPLWTSCASGSSG